MKLRYFINLSALLPALVFTPLVAAEEAEPDGGAEAPPAATISVGENFTITSGILGEDRPYMVYLPEGCKKEGASAPCPVLYILDGSAHFHYGSGMLARMAGSGQIPEMIMVAIPNTADRGHDLTPTHTMISFDGEESPGNATSGGGNAFFDFLEKELIPEVEGRYAPMPYRLFSGHSLGGLMALHGFIDRPGLFQGYIAVDPSLWWDDQELVKRAEAQLKTRTDVRNKVFITVAEHRPRGEEGAIMMETASERFTYAMEANPSPQLHSAMKQYPGEDHGSVAMPSLYDGLLFVFDGYKIPPPAVTSQGLEAVIAYYRDYLAPYGIELAPPGGALIDMARVAQENGEMDKALTYMEFNFEQNPDDAMANFMLGMTYVEAEKTDLAIKHLERAMELAPQFATYVQPELDALKK